MENTKTKNYVGRLELFQSLGCQVDCEGRVSRRETRNGKQWILIVDCDVNGDWVHHLRIKTDWVVGKGERIKFKAVVYMYDSNTKVGLTNVSFT